MVIADALESMMVEEIQFDTIPESMGGKENHGNAQPIDDFIGEVESIISGRNNPDADYTSDEKANLQVSVKKLLVGYTDSSPALPWLKERLNPYSPNSIPCHRLELDYIARGHNWRDAEADTAAIPFAPPVSYLLHPPENIYRGNYSHAKGFDQKVDLVTYVRDQIYSRGIDHLFSIGHLDEVYHDAVMQVRQSGDSERTLTDLMITWAIDSAIPGVDIARAKSHTGSVEAILEAREAVIEIPDIGTINQMAHQTKDDLQILLKERLRGEKGDVNLPSESSFDERSVDLFMRVRSVVDMCRWYVEHNVEIEEGNREILLRTLSGAYSTYHELLQTCSPDDIDDIRSDVFRDVSVLLAGSKLDSGSSQNDVSSVDFSGQEDYLGAFMAVASYYDISQDHAEESVSDGERPYFGTFETAQQTIRQQLTLMCILCLRMPVWQQEAYKELIETELSNKLTQAMDISSMLEEEEVLYVPTQDMPVEVDSKWTGFDWMNESEIYSAQQMMPIMELLQQGVNLRIASPTLQIKPEGKEVVGLSGMVDEQGNFIPGSKKAENGKETEIDVEVFANLLLDLDKIPKLDHSEHSNDVAYQERAGLRKNAVERFVRARTGEVSNVIFPWLETRLNPPPLDILPCHTTELPTNFLPNTWEAESDHALIPHIPPREYLLKPPPNLWQEPIHTPDGWADNISQEVENVVFEEMQRVYGSNPEMQVLLQDRRLLLQLYWTWAQDTRVDGVDIYRSYSAQHMLQRSIEEGALVNVDRDGDSDAFKELNLIMPGDLLSAAVGCQNDLELLLKDVSRAVKADIHTGGVPDYKERVNEIRNTLGNIINVTRWHIEKNQDGGDIDDVSNQVLISAAKQAYLSYNTLLQTCNRFYDKGNLSGDFHDISALIGGYKVDQDADGRYGQRATADCRNDYLDAFMAVAHSRHVAERYSKVVGGIDQESALKREGSRALLGTFEAEKHSLKQQLSVMAMLYQRMPDWQKEVYKRLITDEFSEMKREVNSMVDAKDEPLLFIPSASFAKVKYPTTYPYKFTLPDPTAPMNDSNNARLQLAQAHYLDPITHATHGLWNPFFRKDTAGLEIFHNGARVQGFGSTGHWIDDLGFLHPGNERRSEYSQPAMDDETRDTLVRISEDPGAWLEKLSSVNSVTVESRVGKEMAKTIEKLLDLNPENGSVESLATFAKVLEKLVGKKIMEGDSQYVEMLKYLGMLGSELSDLNNMSEADIWQMLGFIKTENPTLADMDQSSLILLFLGAAGVAPRQELAEQLIKAYETNARVLALESVEIIEKIAEKRSRNIWQMIGLIPESKDKPTSILARRDELRAYLTQKRLQATNYDPAQDEEWREKVLATQTYITNLLHQVKTYDISMKSPIFSITSAKERGELRARCAVNGELLTELFKLLPEITTYNAEYYGEEANMKLPDWLRGLQVAKESGATSHGFNQTNRPSLTDQNLTEIVVADGESGKVELLISDQIKWTYTGLLKFGNLSNQDFGLWHSARTGVLGNCVHGGSHIMATMAMSMNQLDYAEMANPDSPRLNLFLAGSQRISKQRRAAALKKVMDISPYGIAMTIKADYSRGEMFGRLHSVIELGREVGNFGAAFLTANIMKHAGFLGNEANEQGSKYLDCLAWDMAVLGEGEYKAAIARNEKFLIPADLELITVTRDKYLVELAERNRGNGESMRRTRKELKKDRKSSLSKIVSEIKEVVKKIEIQVRREESDQKKIDEAKNGVPVGESDTKRHKDEIVNEASEIVNNTVDRSDSDFEPNRFELLTESAQDKLLMTAITGGDGKLLEGEELVERIQFMQALYVKYAYDHTRLRAGEMGSQLMMGGGLAQISLAYRFKRIAHRLNDRLAKAIERKQLSVDTGRFDPFIIARDMQENTGGIKALLARN